ncbi:hypothetical protein C0992_006656 [Termitomyces sp. T32_za158]|nr:hypothetical protein C0992_006656 [Termitomyces sp. T32_za158]
MGSCLAIPFERLITNLDSVLVEKVTIDPDQYLTVISFGAGASLFATFPSINVEILNFIVTLSIQEDPIPLTIAKARWRSKPKGKSDFQMPWTLILSGFSMNLYKFLVWQQTFAVTPTLAFSIVPFDKDLRSWVIMNILGDVVRPGLEAKTHTLGTIKSILWHDTRFRAAANAAMSESSVPGLTDECALKATQSFQITYIESHNASGEFAPIWQLTGKPITKNANLHKAVIVSQPVSGTPLWDIPAPPCTHHATPPLLSHRLPASLPSQAPRSPAASTLTPAITVSTLIDPTQPQLPMPALPDPTASLLHCPGDHSRHSG